MSLIGWDVVPCHDEELAHHARTLTDVLLHEFRAGNANKAAVSVMGNCTRQQRFAGACDTTN
jgi:hypothetical protein